MRAIYYAKDGTAFTSAGACIAHEADMRLAAKLTAMFKELGRDASPLEYAAYLRRGVNIGENPINYHSQGNLL